jgi:hypothetical protein
LSSQLILDFAPLYVPWIKNFREKLDGKVNRKFSPAAASGVRKVPTQKSHRQSHVLDEEQLFFPFQSSFSSLLGPM